MLVVLLLAVAAPVPQVAVYRDCRSTIDSTEYCPLLVVAGEYNPYCCAERATPGPDEVPVLGVDCFDMFRGATPCPVVVTAGQAAWCCGGDDDELKWLYEEPVANDVDDNPNIDVPWAHFR